MTTIESPQLINKRKMLEGKRFEIDFFGFSANFTREEYLQLINKEKGIEECIHTAGKEQERLGWNPKAPHTPPAQKLFEAVQNALLPQYRSNLHLYCALQTQLDLWGVDGFFSIGDELRHVVTFNLARSASYRKLKNLRANGLVTIDDMRCPNRIKNIGFAIAEPLHLGITNTNVRTNKHRYW